MALLSVENLTVEFPGHGTSFKALQDVAFSVNPGERIGIVGESGAGKSMIAFAIMNLVSEPGRISKGRILFDGLDLTKLAIDDMRQVRGNRITMIFQDPMMTLNPVLTIGTQMVETLQAHCKIKYGEARERSIAMLNEVAIPSAETRFDAYPHELSGGLRQRVVIAIALLTDPSLIVADEPTTALDVTIQAEIVALLLELCDTHNMGLIFITHDLGLVSQITQRIIVIYAGRIIELGPTQHIINGPRHPYTMGLISALPERNKPGEKLNQIPGAVPSLETMQAVGCNFAPRCPYADDKCRQETPALNQIEKQRAACHHAAYIADVIKQSHA